MTRKRNFNTHNPDSKYGGPSTAILDEEPDYHEIDDDLKDFLDEIEEYTDIEHYSE